MIKSLFIENLGAYSQSAEVVCLDVVDSTNSYIKRRMGESLIVTADEQSGGRGQRGRSFFSPRGGVYVSFTCRPVRPLNECLHYTALAGLGVWDAIYSSCGLRCRIKRPNDLLYNGKKVCGILTESQVLADGPFIVFGVGVNVTNALPPDVPWAGRLADFAPPPAPETLAAAIVRNTLELISLAHTHKEQLMTRYDELCDENARYE
ncbi:MAG: biotin--[acetyl-CoA-carboxylase] ligase [Oscillospiraceae bacterium]|nr:biotin--[acetyl-CoA-carboxylase] ligase [Oscillospiraceae bacterium]